MRVKTPPQISDNSGKTSLDIIRHVQAMTDDVRGILNGGLSFADRQLPFEFTTITITSGQPTFLRMQAPFNIIGCIPISTNGNTISAFKTGLVNRVFAVTLTLDVTTAQIGFLMVGTII